MVFVDHLRRQASQLAHRTNFKPGELVVEIGSNDGTLLQSFSVLGAQTVGVDPALNIASEANQRGNYTIPEFFTPQVAKQIYDRFGEAKIVVANNVFAHADDLHSIVEGVHLLIGNRGMFVFEVGYILDMVNKGFWDTVYHEHLCFHHLRPLMSFFERHGMVVVDCERVQSQGGSLRVSVQRSSPTTRINEGFYEILAQEPEGHVNLTSLERSIFRLRMDLHSHDYLRGTVAMFGVPAKATTLLAAVGLGADQIAYAVEENPLKVGKYVPGTEIPIRAASHLSVEKPTTILVAAWNFAQDIIDRHKQLGTRWVVPLPKTQVFEHVKGL